MKLITIKSFLKIKIIEKMYDESRRKPGILTLSYS